ncbi:MAG: fdxN element excision recombinase XisF [Nostocales cyanobacterium 94392]|nr:fdxN element excision recombinase XisF [Nostocales cyanobacterium 94392]
MKVGYVRVSTSEQADTDALEQQTQRVKKAGAVRIFADIESGRSDKRSQFNQMLELCRAGEITEIVITRIDRLSRSVISIHKTMSLLEELGVKLIILDSPIDDANSPFGWFSISQMGQLAEFESRLLSSRIKHGFDYFREQKKAAPTPPFGYIRVNEKYALDESVNEKSGLPTWEVARKIIDYFLQANATTRGTINYALAFFGKNWTSAGFRYWIQNPTLRGHTAYNTRKNQNNPEKWIIHENTHIPLISEETFEQIKQRFQDNRRRYSYGHQLKAKPLPLQGQLFCGCCGYRLFIKKSGRYLTYRVRCKKRDTLGDKFCKNKIAIRLQDVMDAVDAKLIARADEIANYAKKALSKKKKTPPEIIKLLSQLQTLKTLPKSEIIDAAIAQTKSEILRIESEQELEGTFGRKRLELVQSCLKDADYWKTITEEEKISIYQKLVDSITILNGEILEIKLLF